ncbi:hypothetical protein [uncultured Nostoc sp.]|uniref:hypothetical protein n=1 Tax=uncultured Nostoc sp. TaxID=340711 RepID=UPI0035CC70DF
MPSIIQIDSAATPRATQIAQIIQKRRPLDQKIEIVEINLKTLSAALRLFGSATLENAIDVDLSQQPIYLACLHLTKARF